jgi:anti-sigma regulatory factor (Ser/Thr protein kinase)
LLGALVTKVATPSVEGTGGVLDSGAPLGRSAPSITPVDTPRRLAISLAGGPQAPARARELLAERLSESPDLPDRRLLELLLCELVNNAVVHGGATGSDAVWLRVSRLAGRMRFEVRDAGPGFVSPPFARPPGDAGGFGLRLVDRLAEAWGYSRERGLTRVWFELATA